MTKKGRKNALPSYGELIRKMKRERHGTISKTHELIAKDDPEFAMKYDDLFELLMTKNRALKVETKELVVMGILASKGQYDALKTHLQRALTIGVSREEIIEVLELAMLYGGTESLIHGGLSLIEILGSRGNLASRRISTLH